jgi:8-oxo-dGTP pyrophosphatase MutT (NUDIX family)
MYQKESFPNANELSRAYPGYRISAKVLAAGSILLGRYASHASRGSELWGLPGGGVEKVRLPGFIQPVYEEYHRAAEREVAEETNGGLTIVGEPIAVIRSDRVHYRDAARFEGTLKVLLPAVISTDNGTLRARGEFDRMGLFQPHDLPALHPDEAAITDYLYRDQPAAWLGQVPVYQSSSVPANA